MDKVISYSFKIFLLKKLAKFSRLVWTETARGGRSRSHTSNIVPAQWPRGLGALNPVLTLNIYFRLSRFQSSLLLIYFREGPNRCSHCSKVWHTEPVRYVSRSARRSITPSQKSHRNHLVCEEKPFLVWFSLRRKSYLATE